MYLTPPGWYQNEPARQRKDRCSWSDVLGHLPPAGRCSQSLPGLVRPGRGMTKPPAGAEGCSSRLLYPAGGKRLTSFCAGRRITENHRQAFCRSQESNLTAPALRCTSSGIYPRLVTLQREACRGCPKASVPHAGLAPAPLRDSGAHPPADIRRWLCDIVSGLQGHDAYADRAAGCVAGGIKHGHAHTGYMIAAGCCAGPAAAKEETWKAVCLTIPWYQFTTSKGELRCTI